MQISFNGWYAIPTKNGAFDNKTRELMFETMQLRNPKYESINTRKAYYMYVNDNDSYDFENMAKAKNIKGVRKANIKEILLNLIKLRGNNSKADRVTMRLCKDVIKGEKTDIKRKGNINLVTLRKKDNTIEIFGFAFDSGKLLFEQRKLDKNHIIQNHYDILTGKREKSFVYENKNIVVTNEYNNKTGIRKKRIFFKDGARTEIHSFDPITGKINDSFKIPKALIPEPKEPQDV